MIILLAGATHTGKTCLAQRLLERYHYPYLSIDHLKMGLIRSGNTNLTPMDDDKLTDYLWPIVREMIKTTIENDQNLIIEGCYIPFNWAKDFDPIYRKHIRYRCLIMSESYIQNHFSAIRSNANIIEQRLDDSDLSMDALIRENKENLLLCQQHGCEYILIDDRYEIDLSQILLEYPVRNAQFLDMALAARIMVTSFRAAFAEFVSADTMDACTVPQNCRWMMESVFQRESMHFLMGGCQGFLCWQDLEESAEIVAIHSLPESWGSGLGHAMLCQALQQIGNRPVHLWAFEKNLRARRFYEKHGFCADGTLRISEFDEAIEVRYVRNCE